MISDRNTSEGLATSLRPAYGWQAKGTKNTKSRQSHSVTVGGALRPDSGNKNEAAETADSADERGWSDSRVNAFIRLIRVIRGESPVRAPGNRVRSCGKICTVGNGRIGYLHSTSPLTMTNHSLAPYSGHNKLSSLLSGPHFSLADKAAALLAGLFDFSVSEGYEDDTGFHFVPVRVDSRPPLDGPVWLGEDI